MQSTKMGHSRLGIGALMVTSIAAVAMLAWWDEQRESAASLDDFAREQAMLAHVIATGIATHQGPPGLAAAAGESAVAPASLHAITARLERPSELAVFVYPPGGPLRASDGRAIDFPSLAAALDGGRTTLRVAPSDSARLGLSRRTAMAGLARFEAAPGAKWGIAVVASAERERDREQWARVRIVLATTVAGGLVVGFGGLALRRQREQLQLERQLETAAVEREGNERLARLSRAATMMTFASGMAHEISTPLGVISGRAEQLLERFGSDERARRAAAAILEQSGRIKDVVRGFLELARGGSPTLQDAAPSAIAQAAVALVAHRFEKAGVQLRVDVPATLPTVRCDPTLLEHALVNLLLNACDATVGGGSVELAARVEGRELAYVVTDDGDGIAQVNVARAAEPFFTTKPRGKGTGLGLAIVSEIAKSHRGSFSIEPAVPRGTRARIQVPLEVSGT